VGKIALSRQGKRVKDLVLVFGASSVPEIRTPYPVSRLDLLTGVKSQIMIGVHKGGTYADQQLSDPSAAELDMSLCYLWLLTQKAGGDLKCNL
jgi:hypothetical protein